MRGCGQDRSVEPETDAEVIAASRVEPVRFAAVFDRHYDAVHRYLARRVGGDLADDLAAETFTVALGARGRYDTAHADARPWLFGIATNLLRHHHRAEVRRLRAYARLDREADQEDGLGGVDARLDAALAGPAIAEALMSLSAGDRDALLLLAWADLRYEEIAVALRIPVGTVRSRLHRARSRLRELLGDSGQYVGDDTLTEALEPDG
ncbi:MAG: RNA polymerase subunit sigma-70 [Chloroflexi bacterium RBG_16_69_14]|nr:MAG: RNA polymerase subunit sigma-70 [Chloroflexi bacterium RBG_16_69_14]